MINTDTQNAVTVVTMTRGRRKLLREAIDSVRAQAGGHVAQHLLIVDDCQDTWRFLSELDPQTSVNIAAHYATRREGELGGPRRLGVLRDIGVSLTATPWVAFLDDDDLWDPTHVQTLLQHVPNTNSVAYSWREVMKPDGVTPQAMESFPWYSDKERADQEFKRLEALGIVTTGSSIMRDSASPDVGIVDGGCWLIPTKLAADVGFSYEYNDADLENLDAEDDKFLNELVRLGYTPQCTERPTFKYRLGGFSNQFDEDGHPIYAADGGPERIDWS